ncbi:hypothetical protein Gpo141_00008575 [Globisporangium polare]
MLLVENSAIRMRNLPVTSVTAGNAATGHLTHSADRFYQEQSAEVARVENLRHQRQQQPKTSEGGVVESS